MLTKSKILLYLQCPRRLWLHEHRRSLETTSKTTDARMRDGNDVGEVARSLYPDGVMVQSLKSDDALAETQTTLSKSPRRPLFEAAFTANGVLVRADILIPDGASYRLEEVKSSTSVKPYHKQDIAIQAWVLSQAGMNTSRNLVTHINSDFVYDGNKDYTGLFNSEDLTCEVDNLQEQVLSWIDGAKRTVEQTEEPEITPGARCNEPFECPFKLHCSPPDSSVKYPLRILPYGAKLASELEQDGFRCLTEVDESRLLTERQKRVWRVSKNESCEIDPKASEQLNALPYPWFLLDFETIAFPVPRWKGTSPYMQVPFQWSCHVVRSKNQVHSEFEHREFLSLDGDDPRYEFAQKLIAALEDKGTIVVYNEAFEKSRIKELAVAYPELKEALNRINERVFDLLKVTRDCYYHPKMMGSWSIKKVLPTVTASDSYVSLAVQDGGMAQEAYRMAIKEGAMQSDKEKISRNLREYCGLDTLSMWFIADKLMQHRKN